MDVVHVAHGAPTLFLRYEIEVGLQNHQAFCGSRYFQDCEPHAVVNFVDKQIHAPIWLENLVKNFRIYDKAHLGS
jgi:hypothetical protein